jgi:hypothetical protein
MGRSATFTDALARADNLARKDAAGGSFASATLSLWPGQVSVNDYLAKLFWVLPPHPVAGPVVAVLHPLVTLFLAVNVAIRLSAL